jgi:hypothetical protein
MKKIALLFLLAAWLASPVRAEIRSIDITIFGMD